MLGQNICLGQYECVLCFIEITLFQCQVRCSVEQGMENVVNLLSTAGGELLVQIPVDIPHSHEPGMNEG